MRGGGASGEIPPRIRDLTSADTTLPTLHAPSPTPYSGNRRIDCKRAQAARPRSVWNAASLLPLSSAHRPFDSLKGSERMPCAPDVALKKRNYYGELRGGCRGFEEGLAHYQSGSKLAA